jgi:urease subunit gamma
MLRTREENLTRLTETERDRLLLWSAAELARRRRARGLKLSHPEAVALICDETMERAREGATLTAAREHGLRVLRREDVMEGVPELARLIEVEAVFEDGPKLVTLRNPIR